MKRLLIAIAVLAAATATAQTKEAPLEQKLAEIDAGKYVGPNDKSVERARELISGMAKCYRAKPIQVADLSAKAMQIGKQEGLKIGLMEFMDGALIACGDNGTLSSLQDYTASYITVRKTTGQTHHQAVRGILILSYATNKK